MNKNLVYIGIVALAVIAVILGYNIYQQQKTYQAPLTNQKQSQTKTVESPAPTSKASKTDVLTFPGPNATADETKKFSEHVNQIAQETDTLNIGKCSPSPLALKTKLGASINLRNDDTTTHKIIFNPEYQFTLNAGETKAVKADFGHGDGIYSYICDKALNAATPIGVFLLVK